MIQMHPKLHQNNELDQKGVITPCFTDGTK